jgi:hypothetical protein
MRRQPERAAVHHRDPSGLQIAHEILVGVDHLALRRPLAQSSGGDPVKAALTRPALPFANADPGKKPSEVCSASQAGRRRRD